MKKKLKIKSKYNNATFSYKSVPSKFQSVTDGTIRKTKSYSLDSVQEQFPNYPASALKGMIMSVAGDFNSLYATLEGDYSSRETKLKKAYAEGYAELGKRIAKFQIMIQNHNAAYENYREVSEEIMHEKLSNDLKYSDEKIAKLQNKLKELEP